MKHKYNIESSIIITTTEVKANAILAPTDKPVFSQKYGQAGRDGTPQRP
jgi:hypothetical protein